MFLLQVVTSHSGQWCFGVLLNLLVTWWFKACAHLQQLRTFWGPHSSQPEPWNRLHHHTGCECLPLVSYLIFFLAFTVAVFPSQACTGGGCTLSPPSQAHTEESSPENVPAPLVTPLSPHAFNVSWTLPYTPNGEKTSARAAVTRHRPLKLQEKTMFRIHFKYTLGSGRYFCTYEAEGFVWRRLNTRAWEIHQENKRKAGWGGQKKEKGELDKGVQRSCSCRWRQTESASELAALHQAPFKWMKSAPFWLKGELQADSHSSVLIALFYLHFTCSTITTLFHRECDGNLV